LTGAKPGCNEALDKKLSKRRDNSDLYDDLEHDDFSALDNSTNQVEEYLRGHKMGSEDGDSQAPLVESENAKRKRLIQNRKSAQKCRLKKKAEFLQLREDVGELRDENK